MRQIALACFIFLTLISCAKDKPMEVVCATTPIQLPKEPISPLRKINDKSTPDQIVKAYAESVVLYRGWMYAVNRQVTSSQ